MLIDLNTAEKVAFDLDGRIMFDSEKTQIIHLTLQPGEEIAAHSNPFDVVFYILEGEAIVSLEEESIIMNENQSFHIKADLKRGCKNASNEILRFLVTKILK